MTQSPLKLPAPSEIAQARAALRALCQLERDGQTMLRVEVPEGKNPITALIPRAAFDMFLGILQHMANGEAVGILPRHAELTTQEAADILNVSRPHLVKLLETGVIPHHKVGRHRRVRADDVLGHLERARQESGEALAALTALSEDLGLY